MRPRTQKNFEAKAKDRPFRGQGQRSRIQAQVFSKKKVFKKIFKLFSKKGLQKFFSGDFHLRKTKKGLRKFSARFLALSNKISTAQKIVLSSSQGQSNFRGLEASRPRPRTSKSVLEAKDVLEDSTSGIKNSSKAGRHHQFIYSKQKLVLHWFNVSTAAQQLVLYRRLISYIDILFYQS